MIKSQKIFSACLFILISGCTQTLQLYEGPRRPPEETATLLVRPEFPIHVNGRAIYEKRVSVEPGTYRIVVEFWRNSKRFHGYIELDAKAGRSYSALAKTYSSGVQSWAIDLDTCEIVAGIPPRNLGALNPVDLGCTEQAEENKIGNVASTIILAPILLGAIVVTDGLILGATVTDADAEECLEGCYVEPDIRESDTAQLLLPPWRGQVDEACDETFVRFPFRCLLDISINGLHVEKNKRSIKLVSGRHSVVFKVVAKVSGITAPNYYHRVDGIAISVESDGVYALCITPDSEEKTIRTWMVDNKTGQTVAGWKSNFNIDNMSRYSRFCPRHF